MDLRVATDGRSEGERSEPSERASGDGGTASSPVRSEPRDAERGEASRDGREPRDEGDDGTASSETDARRVVVDREDPTARWRWRCPNRHCDWEPTNSHIWCATCASLHDVDPEYWELLDTKTDERVPWGAVEFR